MLKERMNLTEIMSGMEEEFRKRGQAYTTQLNNLCQWIIRLHEERGLEYLKMSLSQSIYNICVNGFTVAESANGLTIANSEISNCL